MRERFSLHKIYSAEGCPFDEFEYSRFKFGDKSYAEKFAEELFSAFIAKHKDLILAQAEIILFPSPYFSIPTASNFLCAYFKDHLNRFLYKNNRKACVEGKIHRNQTYVEDYGSMDFEERMNLIANDTYYIDRNFVQDNFCLFLDDIKITGSHERTVNQILEQYQVKGDFFFLYYAELLNKTIHPRIENHYNYFAVQSLSDIVRIINSDSFEFNTRIVKFILLMDEFDFDSVLQNLTVAQQTNVLDLAVSNNYHQVTAYQNNIKDLNNRIWSSADKAKKVPNSHHSLFGS